MKNLLSLVLILGCSGAYANQQPTISYLLQKSHVVLQAGAYWSHQGRSQHINIQNLIGDEFTLHRRHDSNIVLGFGYFIDGQHVGCTALNYGINVFYFPKATVAGHVIQEELFDNLSYHYKVSNLPIYAEVRSQTPLKSYPVSLTLNGGIGPNFIRTSSFREHSLDGGITIPDHIFKGDSSTTFSATIGVGIQWDNAFNMFPLECGYRFFYLGKGQLGRRTNQATNKLHTGSVYANTVICSVHI